VDSSFCIQGVLLYAGEGCLLSLLVGWMVNYIELIWFASVIKITGLLYRAASEPQLWVFRNTEANITGKMLCIRIFSELVAFADFIV